MISTVGAGGSSWLIKLMLQMFNGRASFADYERADARIRSETNVPFAVIRPYALTNKPPTGKYKVIGGRTAHIAKPIPRPDVAKFFLDCVEDPPQSGYRRVQPDPHGPRPPLRSANCAISLSRSDCR